MRAIRHDRCVTRPSGAGTSVIPRRQHDWVLCVQNARNFDLSKVPCGPTAFQTGIAGGAVAGAWRFSTTRHIISAGNAAVAVFMVLGLGSLEWCRYRNQAQVNEALQRTMEATRKKPVDA